MKARRPSDGPVIALDATGGDPGPATVLAGAALALTRYPDTRFLIAGDPAVLSALPARHPALAAAAELRPDPQPSMRLAVEAVRSGEADGVVSTGDGEALTTLAAEAWQTLAGIDRPAIAAICPTLRGESVLLDLGATTTCRAENLVQFAVLGALFARSVLGLVRPTLGLLNAGSQGVAATEGIGQAHGRLARTALPGDYRGLVAGDDIAAGTVDVIVADGFAGHVARKAAAGAARLAADRLDRTLAASLAARLGALFGRMAFAKLRWRSDPRRDGAAVLLGLHGIGVSAPAGADASGIADAVGVAVDLVRHGFNDQVVAAASGTQAGAGAGAAAGVATPPPPASATAAPLARQAVGA